MTRVGFVVHQGRPDAVKAAQLLEEAVAAEGAHSVRVADLQTLGEALDAGPLDLVVSVGGDGTFLRAAHIADTADCPVLGVKSGRVGFLTEVVPEDAGELIAGFLAGSALVEERLAVLAQPSDGSFEPQWALNEVIVEKKARHRVVRLAVEVDGSYVTTLSADGVIVATPTGSTAYSFSARGPIVSPQLGCLVLTPIAAHMVFDRSFVLEASQRVTIQVVGEQPGLLSADGRESLDLPVGSRVSIGVPSRPVRLVTAGGGARFLTRVREKFGLPGDPSDVVGSG